MAAYSFRNTLTGALTSKPQKSLDGVYDDVLNSYIRDDNFSPYEYIDDDVLSNLSVGIPSNSLTINGIPITVTGLILVYSNKYTGPILNELSLSINPTGPRLKELSLSISTDGVILNDLVLSKN